jgi:hypothetical protein
MRRRDFIGVYIIGSGSMAALRQARRQRDIVLAQNAALWLPEAKIRNAGYKGGIVVVQGDERFLIECLRKLKYRFVVQFPNPPPCISLSARPIVCLKRKQ